VELRQFVMLAFQVSILCIVFGFGLRAAPRDLLYLLRRPGLLLRSLLSVLVVMPIVAVALATMFDVRREAEIALIALAISPVPPLLPRKEVTAGGRQSYALALMVVLALVSIVAAPAAIEILQRVVNRPLGTAPGAITRIVLTMAVLPLVAGMAVRAFLPAFADRIDAPVALTAKVLLPLAIVVLLAGTWRAVWDAVGGGAVIAMVVFVAIGLVVGDFFGRPEREHSIVLALSSACRHPGIALSIASANFPDEQFAGTILLYLIINAVVGMAYLGWRRRQVVAAASSARLGAHMHPQNGASSHDR
jgi:BASS family bile acid:Na+ symporter